MQFFFRSLAGGAILAVMAASSRACLWDSETLAMELQTVPTANDLITGQFVRHSDAYYRWRIQDRRKRLMSDSAPELYDDLGVAHDKLGGHEAAIETAEECERLFPGRYETAANLGTFHIHAGDFEKGIEYIDRALGINPEAHFGREKYQKLLVQYLLTKRVDRELLYPLDGDWEGGEDPAKPLRGFASFCLARSFPDAETTETTGTMHEALVGIRGMMRFGNHESPALLEALGDLLLASPHKGENRSIAARAYLRAADVSDEPGAIAAYRRLAAKALGTRAEQEASGVKSPLTFREVEYRLAVEIEDANAWYGEIANQEREWIAAGLDVDAEFGAAHYVEPKRTEWPDALTYQQFLLWRVVIPIVAVAAFGCLWHRARSSPGDSRVPGSAEHDN